MLVKLAAIFFSMILVNNYVLVKFYGICPFLGVSKKLDSSIGMSGAVIFVMLMATAVIHLVLERHILHHITRMAYVGCVDVETLHGEQSAQAAWYP